MQCCQQSLCWHLEMHCTACSLVLKGLSSTSTSGCLLHCAGLCGHSCLEAAKAVIEHFRAHGFSAIISNNLVNRLLEAVILIIGLLAGVASTLMALTFEVTDARPAGGFCPHSCKHNEGGIIVSLMFDATFSHLIMLSSARLLIGAALGGALASAPKAIAMCCAEAPRELEQNHPEASLPHGRAGNWTKLAIVPHALPRGSALPPQPPKASTFEL